MAKLDKTICTFERCRTQNTRLRVVTVEWDFGAEVWRDVTYVDIKPGERIEVRLRQAQSVRLEELED